MTNVTPPRPASYDKKVGLVLQGGGALGSYQAGVYEALASSEYLPDWVAGISIGAINAAIIAGNPPEHRVERLRNFWGDITATTKMWPSAPAGPLATWQNRASALTTVMFGQPGFFTPRPPQDWFFTGQLRQLLHHLRTQTDTRAVCRFRSYQWRERDQVERRRGQRADRPVFLLR
jgi:NTE family protein